MTLGPVPGTDSSAADPPADDSLRHWLLSLPVFPSQLPALDVAALPAEPRPLFVRWLREVADAGQIAARVMTLATIDAEAVGVEGASEAAPSSRNVLLTDLDENGWQFATHASSRKGRALAAHPFAAATFFWPVLGRQVRLSGRVQQLPTDAAARDFRDRSETARASILVGHQSETLDGPDAYRVAFDRARSVLHDDQTLVDADWAVYALAPDRVEFWQGSTTGPQTRVLYQRVAESWSTSALYP